MIKRKILLIVFGIVVVFLNYNLVTNVSAITSEEAFRRVLINNTQNCYENALVNRIEGNEYNDFNSLMNEGAKKSDDLPNSSLYFFLIPQIDDKYNHIEATNSEGGRAASCYTLFMGDEKGGTSLDGYMDGLLNMYGKESVVPKGHQDINRLNSFMTTIMQYTVNTDFVSNEAVCYTVIKKDGETNGAAPDINLGTHCRNKSGYPLYEKVDDGGELAEFFGGPDDWSVYGTFYNNGNYVFGEYGGFEISVFNGNQYQTTIRCSQPDADSYADSCSPVDYYYLDTGRPASDFFEVIIEEKEINDAGVAGVSDGSFYLKGASWKEVVSAITNGAINDKVKFTSTDKHEFYKIYLAKNYGVDGRDIMGTTCLGEGEEPDYLVNEANNEYWIYNKASSLWCRAAVDKDKARNRVTMTVFSDGENYVLDKVINSLPELIELMGALDVKNDNESSVDTGDIITDEPENYEQDACYAGSGNLGWIICPVVSAATSIGEKMWGQIEEYHLKIPAKEVFKDDGGVKKGWDLMRGFANIMFIILFLFVIFSQLTGYGIDNYGIKKILPRLIIVAILVNLSYIICEVAVDVSNILGISLNSELSKFAGTIGGGEGASFASESTGWAAWVVLGGGGLLLFEYLQAGTFAGAFVGIGLLVLGIVIVIVAAMLFLYLILVAREAGIVLSIVLAPVAIVCFALPNMEKIFKKWFSLFKALLIVYPICGAVIGGGQLAGSIFASMDNSSMKIAAAIVQVLPYFLIPMLLKNSLALMGNVGAKLSSMGRSWGKRGSGAARGAIRNSNTYKQRADQWKNEQALRRARRTQDGVTIRGRKYGGLKGRDNLSKGQQRRLMAAGQVLASDQARTRKAYEEQFAELNGSDLATEVDNAGRWIDGPDGDQKMAALITALNKAGKEEKVFELLDAHSGKAAMKSTAVSSALIGSGNFLQTAYGKRKEEKTFSEFKNAASKGLADYIKDNGVKDMDKDSLKHINESGLGGIVSSEMVKNGAVSASSPKVREQFNNMLAGQINNISDLSNLKLTANDLSTMDDTTAKAILDKVKGFYGDNEDAAKLAIQNALQAQIAGARSNEQAMSKISPNGAVHDVFFSGSPTPPTPPATTAGDGGGYGADTSAWD